MSALFLAINIPLMTLIFSLMVGVPLWLVLRHPEQHPKENRTVPAYLAARRRTARTQHRTRPAYAGSRSLAATQ